MLVTLVASDVSNNCLGRTLVLAELLERDYDVRIVGAQFDSGVWPPARSTRFDVQGVPAGRFGLGFARARARLIAAIDGDVVVACKPLPTSFGTALEAAGSRRPVVLDIDDDELALMPTPLGLRPAARLFHALVPNGAGHIQRLHTRLHEADAVTVASQALQKDYGGILVPHSKDTDWLRPRPELRAEARAFLGAGDRAVILFLGTPRPWKGLETAAAAVAHLERDAVLVIVGASPDDPYVRRLERLPRVCCVPPQPLSRLPFLLQGADVVVIPQSGNSKAVRQLPSKLLDAMAAARPIIATAVGDLPEVVGHGRGVVVAPDDMYQMAAGLEALLADPAAAAAMGERARAWCIEHASHDVLRARMGAVIDAAVENHRRRAYALGPDGWKP